MPIEGTVHLNDYVHLVCGCHVQLWKVLTLCAFAVIKHETFRCPHHQLSLPASEDLKRESLNFITFMISDRGRESYPFFFRPIINF